MDRTCENCNHKEKTDQDIPCCYCGGGNPEWEGTVDKHKKRMNENE